MEWGVMSCVCGMAFLCGSTLVKVPLRYDLRCLKATLNTNKQTNLHMTLDIESNDQSMKTHYEDDMCLFKSNVDKPCTMTCFLLFERSGHMFRK